MKGLDYSSGRPDLKRVKSLGYGFCVRYLFPPLKGVTKVEATAIRAAGLGLVVVYESYAKRANEGRAAGIADGKTALAFARSIGFPETRPLYFAVDFQPTTADLAHVDAYLQGVAFSIGLARTGVYGSYAVVDHCYARITARFFWQTYAWSSGKVSPHAHLLQYQNGVMVAGANVDLNESRQWDFGSWEATVKPAIVWPKLPVKPATKPVVKPITTKPAIHIMSPSEMLAWMKNLMKK